MGFRDFYGSNPVCCYFRRQSHQIQRELEQRTGHNSEVVGAWMRKLLRDELKVRNVGLIYFPQNYLVDLVHVEALFCHSSARLSHLLYKLGLQNEFLHCICQRLYITYRH